MKTIKFIIPLLAVSVLAGCVKDGEIITTGGASAVELSTSGDAVLDKDNPAGLALTLNWTDNSRLTTSDDNVQAPVGTVANTLQFSASDEFASCIEYLTEPRTVSAQFTHEELNSLVGRLGFESDAASALYVRMSSALASNLEAQYSNVCRISVTPYSIDMTRGYVLNADGEDSGKLLVSTDSNGIYSGFLGVTGWYNWWLLEGNGIVWGNIGDDGGGKPFVISSNDQHWNFWFPGLEGCYYTVVDTNRQEWSALHIDNLTVSGDITGEMTYNRKENRWTLSYEAATAGPAVIRIAGNARLYDSQTGTDDALAADTPVAFGEDGSNVIFGTETGITVDVYGAGEATLVLDLSDPFAWSCSVIEGAGPTGPEAADALWAVGIDDGISGGWNFDQRIWLTDEDELRYVGVCDVNSLWGYQLLSEKDNWSDGYTQAEGDGLQGSLKPLDGGNITAPEAGLYLMDISLSEMTYSLTAVNSVQITGINDDWGLTEMYATDTPAVFAADIEVTASTPWGFKILLDESWDSYFGGKPERLSYGSSDNIPFDDSFIGSTVTVTVDFRENNVTFEKK